MFFCHPFRTFRSYSWTPKSHLCSMLTPALTSSGNFFSRFLTPNISWYCLIAFWTISQQKKSHFVYMPILTGSLRAKSHSNYVRNVWKKRLWHILPHGQRRKGPRHFLWLWKLYYTIWHQAEAVVAHHHKQARLMSPREDSTSKSGYFSFIQIPWKARLKKTDILQFGWP